MPKFNANNLAGTELSQSVSKSDTTISVVDASVFPATPFLATIDDNNTVEIVKATAISSDTLTVERGKEDTTAQSFNSGVGIEQRFTAGMYENLSNIEESEISHSSIQDVIANEHIDHSTVSVSAGTHLTGGGDLTASRTLDVDETGIDVTNLDGSSGTSGQVLSTDGSSLSFTEVSGGLDTLADTESLIVYKESFNSFRNRGSWIEHIFNNEEEIADEITSNQVLNHYIFEAENDKYDRFIDPNHNLGLFKYNNSSEPTLSSVYEATMFLAPTSFYEGLLTVESIADTISNSSVLMDAVMTGDKILENQFGLEQSA